MFVINFIAVCFAFLPWWTSGQTQTGGLTCYQSNNSHNLINVLNCQRVLNNIVYDSNNRLDGVSTNLLVWHKTCAVKLVKTNKFTPTRSQVEKGVSEVLQVCNSKGGVSVHSSITTWVYHATPSTTYRLNQPQCESKKCMFHTSDCVLALNQFPVDARGNFVPNIKNYGTRAVHGNCSVAMSTTDHSGFKASHLEVNAALKSLLNRCGHHPGKIYIGGGTLGYNGDTKVSVRGTGMCS